MTKFLKLTFVAAIFGSLMTSCFGDDSGENYSEAVLNGDNYFNVITDMNANGNDPDAVCAVKAPYYRLRLDNVSQTMDIAISNLKTTPNATPISIQLTGLKFTINEKTLALTVNEILPQTTGGMNTVTNFKMDYVGKYCGFMGTNVASIVANISFELNNRYRVQVMPVVDFFYASTICTNNDTGKSFTTSTEINSEGYPKAAYSVRINPETLKASVILNGAKFLENMPAQNLLFDNIPVVLNYDGGYTLSADKITPSSYSSTTSKPTPNDQYPVTDFKFTMSPYYIPNNTPMQLSFDCTPVKIGTTFSVESECTELYLKHTTQE